MTVKELIRLLHTQHPGGTPLEVKLSEEFALLRGRFENVNLERLIGDKLTIKRSWLGGGELMRCRLGEMLLHGFEMRGMSIAECQIDALESGADLIVVECNVRNS